MNKAIFLDRDGTINIEKGYLHEIKDFEFLPGVIEGLRLLEKTGFKLIIITNQSGIARGFYSEDDFNKLNNWMIKALEKEDIRISKVYYCPHLVNAKIFKYRLACNCRKPLLGMFQRAVKDFNLNLSKCYAIGDKIRDCSICNLTECYGYLIGDNEDKQIIKLVKNGYYKHLSYKYNLFECAIEILQRTIKE